MLSNPSVSASRRRPGKSLPPPPRRTAAAIRARDIRPSQKGGSLPFSPLSIAPGRRPLRCARRDVPAGGLMFRGGAREHDTASSLEPTGDALGTIRQRGRERAANHWPGARSHPTTPHRACAPGEEDTTQPSETTGSRPGWVAPPDTRRRPRHNGSMSRQESRGNHRLKRERL